MLKIPIFGTKFTHDAKVDNSLHITKSTGTGLGLSYCKNMIEQHGGRINVSTNPTKFTMILPSR